MIILISILYKLLDKIDNPSYILYKMYKNSDRGLVKRFVTECARRGFTLAEMGAAVGKTRAWASLIINGRIKRGHWRTRNLMKQFLGEL